VYYDGDDILTDDDNRPIDNKDQLVGENNLTKFGHGSRNSYIVYIRNELLGLDMEVVLRHASFVEEVHGLKHSDQRSRRRRRFENEA
jgi:hypothetical protein